MTVSGNSKLTLHSNFGDHAGGAVSFEENSAFILEANCTVIINGKSSN